MAAVICLHNVGGEDSGRWGVSLEEGDVVRWASPGWARENGVGGRKKSFCFHLLLPVPAMSSYLFIIKSELPLVIGTFLDMDPEG